MSKGGKWSKRDTSQNMQEKRAENLMAFKAPFWNIFFATP